MLYLIVMLWPYLLIALAAGAVIGWYTAGEADPSAPGAGEPG